MITSKLPTQETTIFTVMSAMAQEYQALNLSQGFPDFPSDPVLIELVAQAMKDGYNQYAPMQGYIGLREALCSKYQSLYGHSYLPDTEVTITAGATQALFTAFAALVQPGDEVILFAPAYDCYEPSIRLFGGTPVIIQMEAPQYVPDWEAVANTIGPKTKAIVINSPNNPSGTLWSQVDMRQLEHLAVSHDLVVISDEVYEHIVFDGESHQSAARFPDLAARSFVIGSFGKTFHNTGWKMGFCMAPQPLMLEFQKVHQFNVFAVNHPVQRALARYLETPDHYLGLPDFYQQKRDRLLEGIKDSRFSFTPAAGTYFQLLDYSGITQEDDRSFAARLTKENGLATIPTSVFNKDGKDDLRLRVCFAKTDETLDQAIELINTI